MNTEIKKEKQKKSRIAQNNIFMLKLCLKHGKAYFILNTLQSALFEVVIFFEYSYSIKYLIDSVQYGRDVSQVFNFLFILTGAVVVWNFLINSYWQFIYERVYIKMMRGLEFEMYKKAVTLDLSCYDNPEFYTDFVWALSEIQKRASDTLWNITIMIKAFVSMLLIGGFMFTIDYTGFAFVFVSFVGSFAFNILLNKKMFKMEVDLKPLTRKRDYINRLFYLNDYAKEMRLLNIDKKLRKDFHADNEKIKDTIKIHSKKQILYSFFGRFVFNNFVIDGAYMVYLLFITIVKKMISYGDFTFMMRSAWRLKRQISDLAEQFPRFQENSLYIEKIRTFMEYETNLPDLGNLPVPKKPAAIEFKDVVFRYNEKSEPVINGISLSIKAGEKVAFVGYNGAGKTTLVKLLMRLYDVSSGEVLYNNENIRQYGLDNYRGTIGTVFQDYQLFALSIGENVLMDRVSDEHHPNIHNSLDSSGFLYNLTGIVKDPEITAILDKYDERIEQIITPLKKAA